MNSANAVSRERDDMVGIALHDPLKSVSNPEDFDSIQFRANCRRCNDAVDARRRTAADQNRELPRLSHNLSLYERVSLIPANVINSAPSLPVLLQISYAIQFVRQAPVPLAPDVLRGRDHPMKRC